LQRSASTSSVSSVAADAGAVRAVYITRPSSLLIEDAPLVLLFSLVANGQFRLRTIDGWRKIAAMLHRAVAA